MQSADNLPSKLYNAQLLPFHVVNFKTSYRKLQGGGGMKNMKVNVLTTSKPGSETRSPLFDGFPKQGRFPLSCFSVPSSRPPLCRTVLPPSRAFQNKTKCFRFTGSDFRMSWNATYLPRLAVTKVSLRRVIKTNLNAISAEVNDERCSFDVSFPVCWIAVPPILPRDNYYWFQINWTP